jgi:catechol 2,3-dioxygenase-like lactoylglutathione lyase family enzyme
MATSYHINPRIRAYGKARIDITQRAKDEEEWLDGWRQSLHPFAFEFKDLWKFNIEYIVDDFAAEVGFYVDILGFPVSEFSPSHAQFTTPDQEFSFSVAAALEDEESTNPETFRIQFMIDEIMETCEELQQRGISFEQFPQPLRDESNLYVGYFRSPHGIPIDLWGYQQDVEDEELSDLVAEEDSGRDLDKTSNWEEIDQDDSEETTGIESPQTDGNSLLEDPLDTSVPIDPQDDSQELVYENEEDPDLVNKLIDSFDRFRSSRPLSKITPTNSRTRRKKYSPSNRSDNKEIKLRSANHHVQGNL